MIRYLKDRGTYVLFNTNGTLLIGARRQELIDTGLDELRVSLDAADARRFTLVRGNDLFDRIVRDVRPSPRSARTGHTTPRVSLWLTGLKETVEAAARFRASGGHELDVGEVYLQRLVFSTRQGPRPPESALFAATRGRARPASCAKPRAGAHPGHHASTHPAPPTGASLKRGATTGLGRSAGGLGR